MSTTADSTTTDPTATNPSPADPVAALRDPARVAAVRRYEILDAPTDGAFDEFAAAAAAVCGTPIATVSIVDTDRVWFAATHGLDGVTQVGTEPGLCASAFCAEGPYVINDAAVDPRTLEHPLVRGELGLRFYAAAPIITADGHHLGTVTAIDSAPRQLTDAQTAVLGHLAALVARQLELRLAALTAVRAERHLRAEAEQRAAAAAELAARMRAATAAHATAAHPEHCQLGGTSGCTAPAELKIADAWGDSAWGCTPHVEEAIVNVRSVFIASEELGGLAAYLNR
ncbi:GAF domain-containing protein [Micromonospora sp. KC723]|uniref:GAF domain-containing protein n=1 Tax=Micromonospora sp. KC723 TaxID=2530381 RepID=UPI0010458FD7|nr:GAF domain-containing protein [Micromonospora sp. KC723]TDB74406.1 GAF domain-containing protein [Micromonospora sp. KC723]